MMVYINGKYLKKEKAKISIFDHGFLYGDSVFETLRIYNGNIFRFNKHIVRLKNSGSLIGLNISISNKNLKKICNKLISKNKLKEAKLRITVTRGVGMSNLDPSSCKKLGLIVTISRFKPYSKKAYKEGIKVKVLNIKKNIPQAIPYNLKSGNYLSQVLAKKEALLYKSFEGIMLNNNGEVAEGIISNLFIVKGKILFTPKVSCGGLNGITRGEVVKLARGLRIRVKEIVLTRKYLYKAEEAFFTSTLMEVMPIRKIDNYILGRPGPLTKILIKKYNEMIGRFKR